MKKVLKAIVYTLAVLISLPVLYASYLYLNTQFHIGTTNAENQAYLNQHVKSVGREQIDETTIASLLDEDFYKAQVILLGENHGFADVQKLDEALVKHLNIKLGLRYYLAEMDSTRAAQLNTYLTANKPNDSLLYSVVKAIGKRIPQQSSQQLFAKWQALHQYNQDLPEDRKLIVLGIDTDFDHPVKNRDSVMLVNFNYLVETNNLQHEQFFGLFGYTHVLQQGYGAANHQPFAARLTKANLPYAQRVISLACYTLDSEMFFPANGPYGGPADEKLGLINADGPLIAAKGIQDLAELSQEETISLFKLNGENSPYNSSQHLAGLKVNLFGNDILPTNKQASTTDMFQYAVLLRNSPALTGLN